MVPDDIRIPGYTLDHQHEVDHFYIFIGNPLNSNMTWFTLISLVGIICGVVALLAALIRLSGVGVPRSFVGVLATLGLLGTAFIVLFVPTYIAWYFNDTAVWWYSLKGYWVFHNPSMWFVAGGLVASVIALVTLMKNKRPATVAV